MDWSTRRKTFITIGIILFLFLLVYIPLLLFWYNAPSCFDNVKNGNEEGIDCGGGCTLICANTQIKPLVLWQRSFRVLNDQSIYNAVSYIRNTNVGSHVDAVSYEFQFYNDKGELIGKRDGVTSIPSKKQFAIFEGNISLPEEPARTLFSFTSAFTWVKDTTDTSSPLTIITKSLLHEDTLPQINATIKNSSLVDAGATNLVAIVYDGQGTALGVSKTYIDKLKSDADTSVTFTWPKPFPVKEVACQLPVDSIMVLDRSGSMNDDGGNPPEPIHSVKISAEDFVNSLQDGDQAGVVSFAAQASQPIDSSLSSNLQAARSAVDAITIGIPDNEQYTNLGDGLLKAQEEMKKNGRVAEGVSHVVILLTDGIASRPLKSGDENYPEEYALQQADILKSANIKLYVIGLGNDVHTDFLKQLATSPGYYYGAATTDTLTSIYSNIATTLCKEGPKVIEIIPQTLSSD